MGASMNNKRIMSYYNYFAKEDFHRRNYYEGNDLGARWTKQSTFFRIWAPTASQVKVTLYRTEDGREPGQSIPMKKDIKGTWVAEVYLDLQNVFYTYSATVQNETRELVDPYAKAVGVNGSRGVVIDLDATHPEGFEQDTRPELINSTDAIIYEVHVRDFSVDSSSGMNNKGKFMAFTEKNSKNSYGDKTGLDHLKELGITHIQLMPSFDFASVDEMKPNVPQYSWGYDPLNYNVPEGSYSTDPYHGEVRIREFKKMVQTLHQNGIRIIMNVVYNHTMDVKESNFNKIVPGYYYRMTKKGQFSNASVCGNETASERAMMRKFMVDSVVYWAKEYHVDGFCFDMMGNHDIQTMNEIRSALSEVDESILIYGEAWTGGVSVLSKRDQARKENMVLLDSKIAAFSDDIRDGIKGSIFNPEGKGFVNGKERMEGSTKFGIVAGIRHDQVDYKQNNYSDFPWAAEPTQTINYVSSHDNLTLWDKLAMSNPDDSEEDRIKLNLFSAAIVLTSQGIPFFQAGEEFLRSKPLGDEDNKFDENSCQSPDSVNSLKWDRKHTYQQVFKYYQGLIAFRKVHSALRMVKTSNILSNLRFLEVEEPNLVAYTVNKPAAREEAFRRKSPDEGAIAELKEFLHGEDKKPDDVVKADELICVIFNANREAKLVRIPDGKWKVYVKNEQAGTKELEVFIGAKTTVPPISAMVLVRN
jgi:pullulanase